MKYLKCSIDGPNGSGKTCTTAQLACGIAKEYGDGGAVHVYDSNDRWGAWKVHIFDKEKIPVVITVGTSLAALKESMDRFQDDQGAVYVSDDLTVPWTEGLAAFAYENGNLPFDRRAQLMNEWNRFVLPFQAGEFHAIACGRLGYWWENIEDPDTGDLKLVQGDSKFNAGGGQNFGFECVLEAEMRRRKRRIAGLLRGKLMMEYVCDIVKDADSIINGQQFVFQGFENGKGYSQGDYKTVLDCFRSHIEFRAKLGAAKRATSETRDLIVQGKTAWALDKTTRAGLLEELGNLLDHCFPGGEKRSKIDAMYRTLTLEYLNGFTSWSRMEEEVSTVNLQRNVAIVKALRERLNKGERINNQSELAGILHLSSDDVLKPGHGVTLLELMLAKSVDAVKPKGPQPIVPIMDNWPNREIAGD
jgi:hypothetical protein